MKKLISVLLIVVMCFSMTSCGMSFEEFVALMEWLELDQSPWDTEIDDGDYKVPIILLHGRASNTGVFFGVHTAIDVGTNSYYGTDFEAMYTNPDSHEILSVEEGRLGDYLIKELGYEPNKNLFAFNYPNQDMVEMNAKRLKQYINNLIDAAVEGDPDTENFVDPDALFKPGTDPQDRQVQFILIGHSMGGLISRFYLENLNGPYVKKLITVCTPHYGSGLGNVADSTSALYFPCDTDLQTDSTLFGGDDDTKFLREITKGSDTYQKYEYAYLHLSPALKGNHHTNVKYYAIGGYDANVSYTIGGGDSAMYYEGKTFNNPALLGVSPKMQNDLLNGRTFSVEFDINPSNKKAFEANINDAINELSYATYGEPSEFSFYDADGDNIVDYMSQFGVEFDPHSYQRVEKGTLIITTGYDKLNHYHSGIAHEPLMYEAVARYIGIDAGKLPGQTDQTAADSATDKWTLDGAQYDAEQDCFILTEDYQTWQCGKMWYNTPIPGDFTLEMDYYTGGTEGSYRGADGIVVAFYADKESTTLSGLDIGFSGCQGYGIELDTYYNDERNDPSEYNHIALVKDHVGNHIVSNLLPESEDKLWHHLKIVVANNVCDAYVDGVLKISVPVEGTGYQWLGITSATGEGHNLHAVKNITVIH